MFQVWLPLSYHAPDASVHLCQPFPYSSQAGWVTLMLTSLRSQSQQSHLSCRKNEFAETLLTQLNPGGDIQSSFCCSLWSPVNSHVKGRVCGRSQMSPWSKFCGTPPCFVGHPRLSCSFGNAWILRHSSGGVCSCVVCYHNRVIDYEAGTFGMFQYQGRSYGQWQWCLGCPGSCMAGVEAGGLGVNGHGEQSVGRALLGKGSRGRACQGHGHSVGWVFASGCNGGWNGWHTQYFSCAWPFWGIRIRNYELWICFTKHGNKIYQMNQLMQGLHLSCIKKLIKQELIFICKARIEESRLNNILLFYLISISEG